MPRRQFFHLLLSLTLISVYPDSLEASFENSVSGGINDTADCLFADGFEGITGDEPKAVNDSANVNEGAVVRVDLAANDTVSKGVLDLGSIVIVTPPTQGQVSVNNDGTADYSHDGTETIEDEFSYTIADTDCAISNTAIVTLTINPVNDLPIANDDEFHVIKGGAYNFDLIANDSDAEELLDPGSINIVTFPSNGIVFGAGDGTVEYTHDGSESFSDTFTYRVSDDAGAESNTATVSVLVHMSNYPPVANDDSASVNAGETKNIDLATNDTDAEEDLLPDSIIIVVFPAHGTVFVNNDGTVDYKHDGSEAVSDRFAYRIYDYNLALSNIAWVTITINPVIGVKP